MNNSCGSGIKFLSIARPAIIKGDAPNSLTPKSIASSHNSGIDPILNIVGTIFNLTGIL